MERLWKLYIERPFQYLYSGQFVSPAGWKHRKNIQSKDFGLIIGLHKSIYIQVEDLQYEIQPGDVLFISPEVPYFGYKPSEIDTSFFWLQFCPGEEPIPFPKEQFTDHLMAFEIGTNNPAINNAIFLPTFLRLTYTDKPFILLNHINRSNISHIVKLSLTVLVVTTLPCFLTLLRIQKPPNIII